MVQKDKEQSKAKQQYNIEKENEELINYQIENIMQHLESEEELIGFIQKIREYRTRIYELKMQLKGDIEAAYEAKNSEILENLKIKKEYYEVLEEINATGKNISPFFETESWATCWCNSALEEKEYPNIFLLGGMANLKNKKISVKRGRDYNDNICWRFKITGGITMIHIAKGESCSYLDGSEVNNRTINYFINTYIYDNKIYEIEKETIRRVNTIKSAEIFGYYEQEIDFWQEMNLKKVIENDDREHFLE